MKRKQGGCYNEEVFWKVIMHTLHYKLLINSYMVRYFANRRILAIKVRGNPVSHTKKRGLEHDEDKDGDYGKGDYMARPEGKDHGGWSKGYKGKDGAYGYGKDGGYGKGYKGKDGGYGKEWGGRASSGSRRHWS
jgi:hypothetical protein